MINLDDVLSAYKSLEESGTWLSDEQLEYSGVGYSINNPLRYVRDGKTVALECHLSDLVEITNSSEALEAAYIVIKQGNKVFVVFIDDYKVNYLIDVMEDYIKDDEE